jgi:hypothetical protein
MKRLLIVAFVFTVACAGTPPPTLTPIATAQFNATQIIKDIDVVRDFAIVANAQVPPVLSTAGTRIIVSFHESAVAIISASPSGWKATVTAALGQLKSNLSAADWAIVSPYVALLQTVIAGVL